jgi:hypothetical protein
MDDTQYNIVSQDEVATPDTGAGRDCGSASLGLIARAAVEVVRVDAAHGRSRARWRGKWAMNLMLINLQGVVARGTARAIAPLSPYVAGTSILHENALLDGLRFLKSGSIARVSSTRSG